MVHIPSGLVRSPVSTVGLQVFSRLALVGVVEHAADAATGGGSAVVGTVWFAMMTIAWGITEVTRYSFYGLSLLGVSGRSSAVMQLITWMRYSLFTVLYPLGVSGELGVLFKAIPSLLAGGYLGCANASAVLAYIIRPLVATANRWLPAGGYLLLVAMYVGGFPGLYLYMFAQRKKVLLVGSDQRKRKQSKR